jgi:hypothetical protein
MKFVAVVCRGDVGIEARELAENPTIQGGEFCHAATACCAGSKS